MAKPENTEFKSTTVVYVLTKDFTCTSILHGRSIPLTLGRGTELRKGYVAMPTQGGLKWGDNTIPDGDFEIFHETETTKTTYTRRKGKG
jgi:hypothetical protein